MLVLLKHRDRGIDKVGSLSVPIPRDTVHVK